MEKQKEQIQRITLDLPLDVYKQLKIECVNNNCSMKDALIYLTRKWLAKLKETKD